MLRFWFTRISFCMGLLASSPVVAQVIVYDSFNYTVGENIIGQVNPGNVAATPSTTSDDAWFDPTSPTQPDLASDPQDIESGSINYPGLAAASGNSLKIPATPNGNLARIVMPLPTGSGSYNIGNSGADGLFFSFTMKLSSFSGAIGAPATADTGGGQLAGFHAGPLPAGTQTGMQTAASYGGQLRIRSEVDGGVLTGKYEFGMVLNNSNGNPPPTVWYDQSFAVDEPVLVVGNYVFNGTLGDDDVVNLWINPMPGAPAPTPHVTTSEGIDAQLAGFSALRTFWFRSDGSLFPGDLVVDELRIGQTYADVTPAAVAPIGGDFNDDGVIDAADYVVWRKNADGGFTEDDYTAWRTNFGSQVGGGGSPGTVPEPTAVVGMLLGLAGMFAARVRRPS